MSGETPTLCPSGSHKKLDDGNGDDADSFASCQSNLLYPPPPPNPPLVQLIPRELSGFVIAGCPDVYASLAMRFDPFWSLHCVTKDFLCPLTVQFDGAEWDRSSSPTERLRPPGPRSSPLAGGGLKFRMPQEGLTMVGERVDPTLPLEKQVYVRCPLFAMCQHLHRL